MAEKWIKGAIKEEGSLRAYFGVGKEETIPVGRLNALISRLQTKAKGKAKLSERELSLLRKANLAKTLRKF